MAVSLTNVLYLGGFRHLEVRLKGCPSARIGAEARGRGGEEEAEGQGRDEEEREDVFNRGRECHSLAAAQDGRSGTQGWADGGYQ